MNAKPVLELSDSACDIDSSEILYFPKTELTMELSEDMAIRVAPHHSAPCVSCGDSKMEVKSKVVQMSVFGKDSPYDANRVVFAFAVVVCKNCKNARLIEVTDLMV